jgi:iron complex outermembrane receptor protein
MRCTKTFSLILAGTAILPTSFARAQESGPVPVPANTDIIVTATKRSETVNRVPMSITAATGDQLVAAGVNNASDLGKIVPGFTFTQSAYSTPVYSIRGVGFYNYDIGSTPTVTVYQDEAPLPFSSMTRGAGFDLERVEVLKGPQGLLFGANSTGGAVNYVAARPTKELRAGLDAGYGRFDSYELGGFISGPVTDAISARLAVRHEGSGDWQRSTSRNATNGGRDFTQARLQFDVAASERLTLKFGLNAFRDKSDVQAAQLIQINPLIPPFADPRLASLPLAGNNARSADWTTGTQPRRDDRQVQGTARLDYELSDALSLTSLTSYAHYKQDDLVDPDGTSLMIADTRDSGSIKALFQELRLSGNFGNGSRWIVGGNYEHNIVQETQSLTASDASGFRFFNILFGVPTPNAVPISSTQRFRNLAAFANVDLVLSNKLTAHAGVRYTDSRDDFVGCTGNSANGSLAAGLGIILRGDPTAFGNPACTQLDTTLTPAITRSRLSQDNVSWRAGLDFKPNSSTLLYVNVSRGYKGGAFPLIPATSYAQYTPVTQESVTAYEGGFKISLANRLIQLNGAAFYYDYKNKQVLGSVVLTPDIFGPLNILTNIPKSRVAGAELDLTLRPMRGLTLNAGATYVDSRIGNFTNFDPFGVVANFEGEQFPNTPRYQFTLAANYEFPVSGQIKAFLGGNMTSRTKTNGALGENAILAIDGYTLVDLRAGVATSNDRVRLSLWGRNVGNKYYWTNAYKLADVSARFAGQPATYGATLSFRY